MSDLDLLEYLFEAVDRECQRLGRSFMFVEVCVDSTPEEVRVCLPEKSLRKLRQVLSPRYDITDLDQPVSEVLEEMRARRNDYE